MLTILLCNILSNVTSYPDTKLCVIETLMKSKFLKSGSSGITKSLLHWHTFIVWTPEIIVFIRVGLQSFILARLAGKLQPQVVAKRVATTFD